MTRPIARRSALAAFSRQGGLIAAMAAHYRPLAQTVAVDANPNVATLRGAWVRIRDLLTAHQQEAGDAFTAAAAVKTLTAQGRADRQKAEGAEIGQRYRTQLDQLEQELQQAAQHAFDAEAAAMPTAEDGYEAFMVRARLRDDAEYLLGAGVGIAQQINEADTTERVHAIIDLLKLVGRGSDIADVNVDVLTRQALRRLHDLDGDVAAFDAAAEVEQRWPEVERQLTTARSVFASPSTRPDGVTLLSGLQARYAGDEIRVPQRRALALAGLTPHRPDTYYGRR